MLKLILTSVVKQFGATNIFCFKARLREYFKDTDSFKVFKCMYCKQIDHFPCYKCCPISISNCSYLCQIKPQYFT